MKTSESLHNRLSEKSSKLFMPGYRLRLDEADGTYRSSLLALLRAVALSYLAVRETAAGENPHFHVYFDSEQDIKNVRQRVRRAFPDAAGNKGYSLTAADPEQVDAHLRYLCKGVSAEIGPDVVAHQGLRFTPENFQLWHEAFWVNRAEIDAARHRRKRLQSATIVERVEEICKHRNIRYNQREEILKVYLKLCIDGKKAISIFAGKSIANTVQCLLCPDDKQVDELASWMMQP